MATGYRIPPPPQNVPVFDLTTGQMHAQWIAWFNQLWALVR